VSEPLPSNQPGADKRRGTRIMRAVPITVMGMDALGQPFKETTKTVTVSCYGCTYQSAHYIQKDSIITVEIRLPGSRLSAFLVHGRIVWVQRPRTHREIYQVAMDLEVPGNVWGVGSPPEDWFPSPEDEELVIPVAPEEAVPEPPAAPCVAIEKPEAAAAITPEGILPGAAEAKPQPAETETLVVPSLVEERESQLVSARQMMKVAAEAAVAQEVTLMRQHLDVHLNEAIERSIEALLQRVADAAVKDAVQRAAERTAEIVEEAQKACRATSAELDARFRLVLEEVANSQRISPRKRPPVKRRRKALKSRAEPSS
jgi:hypothetical protein